MLSGCPKTYRIFWGAGLSARRGCWWRLQGSFGPVDDAGDLAGFVPVEVDEAVGLMSVGVAVSGTRGVAEVVEDEAAVLDETPLLGDLAADEGPVIVSDDAMVAAEAAGEIPPGIVSDEGLTTVDDMIMSGPFRGTGNRIWNARRLGRRLGRS